jgi:hypothetical protein
MIASNAFSLSLFRRSWVNAIEQVKKKLEEESMETEEEDEVPDAAFVDMFNKRGKKQHRSGKSKVVSATLLTTPLCDSVFWSM